MRTAFIFIASLLPIMAALWLRYAKGDPLREKVTKILDYENRALVEHLLAAVGLPLFLMLLVFIILWIKDKFFEFFRLEIVKFRLKRRITPVLPLDEFAHPKSVFLAVVSFAFFYCVAVFLFEWQQATESVYGGPARGCFQYSQFAADCLGAALASITSWLLSRRHHVGITHRLPRPLRD